MRRLKTGRRPPIYPKTPGHLPCSSLTHPLPLPSRRPSVSFGGFGLMCGEVDSEGATTWENTRSENPTAYDSWEYLEAATTVSAACQNIRLALRVTDRSAPHVLYWDDISFRSE